MACSPRGGGSEATAAAAAAAAADGPRAKMLSMEKLLEDELAAVGGDGGPKKGAVYALRATGLGMGRRSRGSGLPLLLLRELSLLQLGMVSTIAPTCSQCCVEAGRRLRGRRRRGGANRPPPPSAGGGAKRRSVAPPDPAYRQGGLLAIELRDERAEVRAFCFLGRRRLSPIIAWTCCCLRWRVCFWLLMLIASAGCGFELNFAGFVLVGKFVPRARTQCTFCLAG